MSDIFKIIFNNLLCFHLILLSWIIPKRRGLVLLSSSDGYNFRDNPKYLYQYLLNIKSELFPYWVTSNKNLFIKFKESNRPVLKIYSLKLFIYILKAEFIVCDDTKNPILLDSLFGHMEDLTIY